MSEKYIAAVVPQEIDQTENPIINRLTKGILMTEEEKRLLFSPAILEMSRMLQRGVGLALPEDVLSRLFIVNHDTFHHVTEETPSSRLPVGRCFSNRVCAIDYEQIIGDSQKSGYTLSEVILMFGIHELWHSLEYCEDWLNPDGSQNSMRRSGIVTKRPGLPSLASIGLHRLKEGFTDILTLATLRNLEIHFTDFHYIKEVETLHLIGQVIKGQPFMQAQFTKNGFKTLYLSMEANFGKDALRKITTSMGDEYCNSVAQNPNQPHKYPKTSVLIHSLS